tara:strand:- start:310 stop:606 length:297 start_codon:yes stop_codon:yes gene_type:complete
MKEAEIPLDFSFVFELAELPSLEDELHLEKEIRSIKASDDIEGIKRYAEETARQNYQQSIFIAGCLTRIAKLQTKVVEQQAVIAQKKPTLLQKILKLQ